MKLIATTTVLLATALSLPAMAQTTNPPTQQNAPGTAGQSKPGVPGLPGNKSGPSDSRANTGAAAGDQGKANPGTAGSDESKVPGMPGNKSGPAQKPASSR
jgi:hypothetical protein